jgi:branched-chain amino acid transport system ATP-binding protein
LRAIHALLSAISVGTSKLLEIDAVSVGYGGPNVVSDVSLSIAEREFVALVGSNNAGKSTLLLTISGVLKPTVGTIQFDGRNIAGVAPHEVVEAGIVHVPERKRLFPRMTVLENLMMGGISRRARPGRAGMIERVMESFPVLKRRRDQLAATLSGGEQQILSIARGLVAQPRLLLLDEPSLGLAPMMVAEIYRVLKALNADGLAILLSEQNVRMSLQVSQRAYLVHHGQILMSGPSDGLLKSDEIRRSYLGGSQ